jgi:hypothetical protein
MVILLETSIAENKTRKVIINSQLTKKLIVLELIISVELVQFQSLLSKKYVQ